MCTQSWAICKSLPWESVRHSPKGRCVTGDVASPLVSGICPEFRQETRWLVSLELRKGFRSWRELWQLQRHLVIKPASGFIASMVCRAGVSCRGPWPWTEELCLLGFTCCPTRVWAARARCSLLHPQHLEESLGSSVTNCYKAEETLLFNISGYLDKMAYKQNYVVRS